MNTDYIYSATRVNTLAPTLLLEADIARILEASSEEDLQKAIKESYVGAHISNGEGLDIEKALQDIVKVNKEVVTSVAPNPKLLSGLWWFADIHNLRVFIKSKNADLDQVQTVEHFLPYGLYDTDTLYTHAVADTLYRLEPELHSAYHNGYRLAEEGAYHKLEVVLDQAYFAYQKRLAETSRDLLLSKLVKLQIDLHNINTRLRTLKTGNLHDFDRQFIVGGTVNKDVLNTYEQTLTALYSFGGEARWREVIQLYEEQNDSLPLELLLQRYVADYVSEAKNDMFSLASLISYILQVKLSETAVRMLFVGKTSGVDKKILQHNVNILYGKTK